MDVSKTMIKALGILDLYTEHSRLTLNQMCKITRLPKTTVHRMVNSLVETGLLMVSQDEGYQLGIKLLSLGTLVKDRLDLRNVALPFMNSLKHEINEAVNLIVRDHNQAIYIEKVDTPQPVRVYTKVGRAAPLYSGACPRIILAYMNEHEREHVLNSVQWKRFTPNTIMTKEELYPVLAEIRRTGYSISHSELTEGSSAVGAPIYDHRGVVIAGLSAVGPEHRFNQAALPGLIEATIRAAHSISTALGYKERNKEEHHD